MKMPAKGQTLAEFKDAHGKLYPAEESLVHACAQGEFAAVGFKRPEQPSSTNRIRAEVLRTLCLSLDPEIVVHEKGIQLLGGWIDGTLDLDGVQLSKPVAIFGSVFDGGLRLKNARTAAIYLNGSRLVFLFADRLQCTDDVHLSSGFVCLSGADLQGAEIAGSLVCTGGTFTNARGAALNGNGAKIGGALKLNCDIENSEKGFVARGLVTLVDVSVGGGLICTGGRFINRGDVALDAQGAKVHGPVKLNSIEGKKQFIALGAVQLIDASIGNLECRGSRFRNVGGDALCADGMSVRGDVILDMGFKAQGETRMPGATIEGDLNCNGGEFSNAGGDALALGNASVKGELWLSYRPTPTSLSRAKMKGTLNLLGAKLTGISDGDQAWPAKSCLRLDGCTYERFTSGSPVTAKLRIEWLDRQYGPHLLLDFRPQPWEQCAKILTAMGHDAEANNVRIEKRRRMRKACWLSATTLRSKAAAYPQCLFDATLELLAGYGYRAMRTVAALIIIWLVGGVLFATAPSGVMAPTDSIVFLSSEIPQECRVNWTGLTGPSPAWPDDAPRRLLEGARLGLHAPATWAEICLRRVPSEYSTFQPWIYALDLVLPFTDLRQEKDWAPRVTDEKGAIIHPLFGPSSTFGWGHALRAWEWVMILSGWLLSLLLAAGLTGILRRE